MIRIKLQHRRYGDCFDEEIFSLSDAVFRHNSLTFHGAPLKDYAVGEFSILAELASGDWALATDKAIDELKGEQSDEG